MSLRALYYPGVLLYGIYNCFTHYKALTRVLGLPFVQTKFRRTWVVFVPGVEDSGHWKPYNLAPTTIKIRTLNPEL